jgi:predicted DNA-binding protein
MSREDSQFKLRLPAELREKIEQSAKDAKRSLNAEIVARLEDSAFPHARNHELISAGKARELAASSRKRTAEAVRSEVLVDLSLAISRGSSFCVADLSDFHLEEMSEMEFEEVTGQLSEDLIEAGYEIEWNGYENLAIDFSVKK